MRRLSSARRRCVANSVTHSSPTKRLPQTPPAATVGLSTPALTPALSPPPHSSPARSTQGSTNHNPLQHKHRHSSMRPRIHMRSAHHTVEHRLLWAAKAAALSAAAAVLQLSLLPTDMTVWQRMGSMCQTPARTIAPTAMHGNLQTAASTTQVPNKLLQLPVSSPVTLSV